MPDDVVLQSCVQEVVRVEVEAPPLERGLCGALQELAGRVAEELGDVDALDLALRRGRGLAPAARSAHEVGEEIVEEAAAPPAERASHPLLGEVKLAQVLDLLSAIGARDHPRRDCWSSVPLAHGLVNGHVSSSLVG